MRFLKTSCCCRFSLRAGTIAIGCFTLILATVWLIFGLVTYMPIISSQFEEDGDSISKYETETTSNDLRHVDEHDYSYYKYLLRKNDADTSDQSSYYKYSWGLKNTEKDEETRQKIKTSVRIVKAGAISTVLAHFSIPVVLSVLLIVGAAKGYMWLMVPWIACTSLSIITAGIFSTFFFILLFYLSFGGAEIVAMLIVFGLIALFSYFVIIVISHIEELRKAEIDQAIRQLGIDSNPWSSSSATILLPDFPKKDNV